MKCLQDDDCSFLYHCAQNGSCQHNSVFPLSIYPLLIYLLIPIASGLVNATGHSMGLFKVLIVMNGLRYQSIQATMITQGLVVGTALPNYFSMLLRKHPTMPTSLVNFNLVYILVPCCLLGSTLGSLITLFVPTLIQEIMTFIIFLYFSWGFYQKYRKFKAKQVQMKVSLLSTDSNNQTNLSERNQNQTMENQECIQRLPQKLVKNPIIQNENNIDKNKITEFEQQQKNQILEYEKSKHIKDILSSIGVFLIFEFLVFLVQGKLPFFLFHHCDWKYWVGITFLIGLTAVYLVFIRRYLKKKFQKYQKFNIYQEIKLNQDKQFNFIMLAGFLAGTVTGILGVGSGSCMMSFLLSTPINASSASATTGYQVLFIGMAALIEGFINGEVNLIDTGFFIGLCFILGGAVTLGLNNYLEKKDPFKVGKIVTIIAVFLSMVSVIMVIPNVITQVMESGWRKIMEIKFSCDS